MRAARGRLLPVRARTLVIFMVIIELGSGITGGGGIAHFAHLGGMAAGFIFLKSDRGVRRFFQNIRRARDRDGNDSWRDPGNRGN